MTQAQRHSYYQLNIQENNNTESSHKDDWSTVKVNKILNFGQILPPTLQLMDLINLSEKTFVFSNTSRSRVLPFNF